MGAEASGRPGFATALSPQAYKPDVLVRRASAPNIG